MLWAKPIRDMDVFKIDVSFCWATGVLTTVSPVGFFHHKASCLERVKGVRQKDFILNNIDQKHSKNFYFNINYGKWLFLNRIPTQKAPPKGHYENNYNNNFATKRNATNRVQNKIRAFSLNL